VIVDTSAIVAILKGEPEAGSFAESIATAPSLRISAVNYVESGAVIDSVQDPVISRQLDRLLESSRISIESVSVGQARIARQAYRDFGKGSGHPARLNFGDCFAYALASEAGESLLFKGEDFSRTDIASALSTKG